MTRFLVIELESGLHSSREVGIFHAVRQVPGVVSVTDLSAISQTTLDVVLFKPPPEPVDSEPSMRQLEFV